MKVSFYLIVSYLENKNKSEKFLLEVKRSVYTKIRHKLFVLDRKKNKKGKTFQYRKYYPVLKLEKINYVVYGVIKKLRIEDILSLDLQEILKKR